MDTRIAELIDIVLKIIPRCQTMTQTIGFIGGGQMAEAIIKGLLKTETYSSAQIKVAEPLDQRRQYLAETYQLQVVPEFTDLSNEINLYILAVKPQVMESILTVMKNYYSDQLIITIAAGLPISYYTAHLGNACPVIRVMPNMGALILEGASALCKNHLVTDADLSLAQELFSAVGSSVIVEERLMDAVTGLSGSGPAYVFSFIEALIEGGVKTGLSRDVARELAVQTVYGAALCLKNSDTHPAVLKDQVTSPGGTTASGLYELEAGGFQATVIDAVEAACTRSRQLGNSR